MERQSTGAAAPCLSGSIRPRRVAGYVRVATRSGSAPRYRTRPDHVSPGQRIPRQRRDPVLRTAFELYKRDDLLSDLIGHYRRQADAAATASRRDLSPAGAQLDSSGGTTSKDEAIAELTKVVEASRAESDLRLDLAELLEQQGELRRSPGPGRRRSSRSTTSACSGARSWRCGWPSATGNIDRARQAAERLFGLRLDTETQISLAGQMHQLGLHELAEAVLGRARRRAGNKATALVGLMLQYQRQDKLDEAVQVAMQILRSTTASRAGRDRAEIVIADDPDAARTAAITVLARSGRLPQLIERANEELKKTPNSVQIHQALADYYTAARQRDKARAELAKIVELRPDDVNLRLRVANQLVQDGQADRGHRPLQGRLQERPRHWPAVRFAQLQNTLLAGRQGRRAARAARRSRPPLDRHRRFDRPI